MKCILAVFLGFFTLVSATDKTSRSVFVPRGLTTNATLELAQSQWYVYRAQPWNQDRAVFSFFASYFHESSTDSCKLAGYFFPNFKTTVSMKEDGSGDLGSLWFGLIAGEENFYSSQLRIRPQRHVDGAYFLGFLDFSRWCSGLWASFSFAAAQVRHNLHLREFNQEFPGTFSGLTTGIQALNNPAWKAGKLSPCTLKKSGVDDIQVKVGYNHFFANHDHLGLYVVFTIPTGKRQTADFLFEPLIGSKHVSVGAGYSHAITIEQRNDIALRWLLDTKYRSILQADQRRSFDLDTGNWSRYLRVATPDNTQKALNGINAMTLKTKVTPGNTVEFWTSLNVSFCAYDFEFGYNLWWQQKDSLCITQCPEDFGIYDLGANCRMPLVSASRATISQSIIGTNIAPSDPAFTQIKKSQFARQTGSMPKSVSQTIYGAFGYFPTICEYQTLFSAGVLYEFARNNTALSNWGLFLKGAVSF